MTSVCTPTYYASIAPIVVPKAVDPSQHHHPSIALLMTLPTTTSVTSVTNKQSLERQISDLNWTIECLRSELDLCEKEKNLNHNTLNAFLPRAQSPTEDDDIRNNARSIVDATHQRMSLAARTELLLKARLKKALHLVGRLQANLMFLSKPSSSKPSSTSSSTKPSSTSSSSTTYGPEKRSRHHRCIEMSATGEICARQTRDGDHYCELHQ